MNNGSLLKPLIMSHLGKMLLIFISSAGLASAQILLTGGDPAGGLTLDPVNVMYATFA